MEKEYEIFSEVCDIENPSERETIIREKCKGDENLYDKIVLLFPNGEDTDVYGKYEIKKKIGEGGMGIVYLAEYAQEVGSESFRKCVALKTISPNQDLNAKNLKLFLNEIKTLSNLEHPNIARFLDIGRSEKGKPFFIMEYVDGIPLTEYCDKNKFSISERILIFKNILGAIEYLHEKGVLHCDIKPHNILVDLDGIPKVIDFGIASKYGSFISDPHSHTTFLQNAFTLNYASPEQISGERKLTCATDVYSLGVVLYELLTGQLPVKFDDISLYTQVISISEKQYPSHIKKAVAEISVNEEKERVCLDRDCKTIVELKDNLTNELDEIIQKALSKRTQKRYETVKEFDAQIEEFLNRQSIWKQIKNIFSLIYKRILRKVRRIPVKWAVASSVVFLLLFGVLSQTTTIRTIPYYLEINRYPNHQLSISQSQKIKLDKSISYLQESFIKDRLNVAQVALSDNENKFLLADPTFLGLSLFEKI